MHDFDNVNKKKRLKSWNSEFWQMLSTKDLFNNIFEMLQCDKS